MEIYKTLQFVAWIDGLRDGRARAKVLVRIERLIDGNVGDSKPIRAGVHELRIDHGPGYRVYYKREGHRLIILLAGGDKKTQKRDINLALALAQEIVW